MDAMQEFNFWQAVESDLFLPLSTTGGLMVMFQIAIFLSLPLMVVALLRLRGRETWRVLLSAGLIAIGFALLIPGALFATMPYTMLGMDIQQVSAWQITTDTFEATAREINHTIQMGFAGLTLFALGMLTVLVPGVGTTMSSWHHTLNHGRSRARSSAAEQTSSPAPSSHTHPVRPLAPTTRLAQQRVQETGGRISIIRPREMSAQRHDIQAAVHIGRNPETCQLVLDNHYVSGYHARIFFDRGQFFLEDCSSNGVHINGEPIRGNAPVLLHPDTYISVGAALLYFSVLDNEQTIHTFAGRPKHAFLIPLDEQGEPKPFIFPITRSAIQIGRHHGGRFLSRYVSRQHVDIDLQEGTYYLLNQSNTSTTYVDDYLVEYKERVPLHNGQIIAMGDQRVRFEIEK
jgi:pSer/pThr/pTyr-binding forkhead associated (FHA) protein